MGYLWSIEKGGLVSSTPNRLGKMERALKRLKSKGIVKYPDSTLEDAPVYSSPLYVKPFGAVTDWESSEARRLLAYKDAIQILLECVNEGLVSQSEGRAKWDELKLHYGVM